MDIREVLGKNLKRMREAWGYTQAQVAEMCNFEPTSYSRWENGKVWPTPETINKLAELFNCSPSWFYRDEPGPGELSTYEAGEVAEKAPFSKLIEIVFNKVKAVPDEVVEMAYYTNTSPEAWEKIISIMDEDMKGRLPKPTPQEMEESMQNAREYRRRVLNRLKTSK